MKHTIKALVLTAVLGFGMIMLVASVSVSATQVKAVLVQTH